MLVEHRRLVVRRRIPHRDADHEAVELRLGQRVGPLVLARVLRREDDERPRQLVRVAVDGDAALLHALEEAGLGLRRGAVDLVDEDDVREDGPGMELEARLALVEDVRADDVRGQEVGGALDAGVLGLERPCQRPGKRGLPDAGMVLDQDVALGEERDDHVADDLVGDLHGAADVLRQGGAEPGDPRWVEIRRIGHHTGMLRVKASHWFIKESGRASRRSAPGGICGAQLSEGAPRSRGFAGGRGPALPAAVSWPHCAR